jgi:hypothetical protein
LLLHVSVHMDHLQGAHVGPGYTHSLNHGTENLLTLHFNGKIWKSITLARTNVGSLKMVRMD